MIKLTTKQLAEILNGQLIGDENVVVENVSTDTRQAVEAGLFFALKGTRFDAHDYVNNALQQGCVALVVERQCDVDVPQIIVADSRLALGQLGKWLKAKINPKTVAMTGSSGKTSVKEMTAAILQKRAGDFLRVLFTQGNFNNDIGVPLTLLRLTEQHQFAVVELGANHAGEIAYTTALVRPDVALINNVAPAHLEGFGSLEGVAQAKGEIYQGLADEGVAIINLDCHYLPLWEKTINGRLCQSFALTNPQADYYASQIQLTLTGSTFRLHSPQGEIEINLPYLGEHNISNALAATALAMNVGASLDEVKQGLEQRSQVKGRLFPIQPCENLLLLDDTYNANVGSMKSAINVLKQYPAFRILAVADMGELGDKSAEYHQQVADFAKAAELDCVVSYGHKSAVVATECDGVHFTEKASMASYLMAIIKEKLEQNQPVVLLAKGSRSMQMEALIEMLKDNFLC